MTPRDSYFHFARYLSSNHMSNMRSSCFKFAAKIAAYQHCGADDKTRQSAAVERFAYTKRLLTTRYSPYAYAWFRFAAHVWYHHAQLPHNRDDISISNTLCLPCPHRNYKPLPLPAPRYIFHAVYFAPVPTAIPRHGWRRHHLHVPNVRIVVLLCHATISGRDVAINFALWRPFFAGIT